MESHCQCPNYSGLFCLRVPWDSHKADKALLPASLMGKNNWSPPEVIRRRTQTLWSKSWWKKAGQEPVALSSSALFLCVIQLQHEPRMIPLRKEGSPWGRVSKRNLVSAAITTQNLATCSTNPFEGFFPPRFPASTTECISCPGPQRAIRAGKQFD